MAGELLALLAIAGLSVFWGVSLGTWRALYGPLVAWVLAFVTLVPVNEPVGLAAVCGIALLASTLGCSAGIIARRLGNRIASGSP